MMWVLQFQGFMKNQTIDNKRSRICNTCIEKLVYAPRGHFMKTSNLIIYNYSSIRSFEVIVRLFHDKDNEL
jgi:hypothetical protein